MWLDVIKSDLFLCDWASPTFTFCWDIEARILISYAMIMWLKIPIHLLLCLKVPGMRQLVVGEFSK